MRVIIAGSRSIDNYDLVKHCIAQSNFTITTVVSGTARGVDKLGERYAKENNIPIKQFYPNWDAYGKSAGYKRNALMAENADALIILIEGNSKGSTHMYNIAKEKGLKIYRYDI